jgi:hypothetical protein
MLTIRRSRWGLVALGLLAVVAAACSSGGSSTTTSTSPPPKVATGTVICSDVTGALTFSPPLTTKGTSPESTAISLSASGCVTKGSNVATVATGAGSATISGTTNSCTNLLNPRALTVDITWSPSTIRPSVLTFSGYAPSTGPSNGEGFILPAPKGTAKVTGSFAGSDQGAASTAATYSGQTATQLLAACGSSAGLPSIQVTSGNLTLK